MIDIATGKPYLNVMFGNFYSPAYDDENFVDDTMQMIKKLGFNSVMLDTKAWEDFRERYETGALSQYVKMQEYMERSANANGLTYNFLVLYLNGDNLYPHIRFSPPIFGEEVVNPDLTPGKWYKYWSPIAKQSMEDHVDRIMERYSQGITKCVVDGKEVKPTCSMWDPIVAPSFDEEGKSRYLAFLKRNYQQDINALNRAYELQKGSFEELQPEEYWFTLRYDQKEAFTEADVKNKTKRFLIWKDNQKWKKEEQVLYFQDMQVRLKKQNPDLFLVPDLTQWGYFLNIDGRHEADHDNDYSELWDTSLRGIDIYALAPYVDSCHFITVPTTPDAYPDAYVTSCQHSMMRVMNEGRTMIGGTYFGRYLYNDLFAQLTPAELIGTMAACGADGYTCYGMNGLDDGGVLNRMEDDFLESLSVGNEWFSKVVMERRGDRVKEIALLFPSAMSDYEPFETGFNKIRRLDLLGWYKVLCDLGYQVDVISFHEIEAGKLNAYKVLVIPANDCYDVEPHPDMEQKISDFVRQGGVVLHGPEDSLVKSCFGIEGRDCPKTPYRYDETIISQGASFQTYEQSDEVIASYLDGVGACVVRTAVEKGQVYSFGVQIGASYTAKNIPHVPYEQNNKEMYPIVQAKTRLISDILTRHVKPASGIAERGIEVGVFENGKMIVNHRSTCYSLKEDVTKAIFQYPVGQGLLLPHSAVWIEGQ